MRYTIKIEAKMFRIFYILKNILMKICLKIKKRLLSYANTSQNFGKAQHFKSAFSCQKIEFVRNVQFFIFKL